MKKFIFSVVACEECGKPLDENHQTRIVDECSDCGCSIEPVELCAEDMSDICCSECSSKY
jgi:hypothetical protein